MTAPVDPLSRRERQVMDILWRLEAATASQIRDELVDPPSYSAVRALLATLVRKGHLVHEHQGRAYVYRPAAEPAQARKRALQRVVNSFFGGSATAAAVALLDLEQELPETTRARMMALIEQAQEDGR
jgi:predicted transcriptional regulator